jgi:hypothetical protein
MTMTANSQVPLSQVPVSQVPVSQGAVQRARRAALLNYFSLFSSFSTVFKTILSLLPGA